MKRLIIILSALLLGACTQQVVDENTDSVRHLDGARYVGFDALGNEDPSTVRKVRHQGPASNTHPASIGGNGPLDNPCPSCGPFPDPWVGDNAAPASPDEP